MSKINKLIRELKVSVNSESHTASEWVAILQQLQEVGQKANIRFQLERGVFAEVVEDNIPLEPIMPENESFTEGEVDEKN